jgi:anti-sigma factor ChrR (cupin superfamily)
MLRRSILLMTFVLAGASTALADDMKMPTNSGDLKWGPAPPALPKGAEFTILSGDPSKDGPYVVRLKVPDGYKIPAHNHPTTEYVTVISGNFHLGMGDKLDEKNGVALTAGGFGETPAKMNHYAWASSPSVV